MCCVGKKEGALIKNDSRGDEGARNLPGPVQGTPFQGDI